MKDKLKLELQTGRLVEFKLHVLSSSATVLNSSATVLSSSFSLLLWRLGKVNGEVFFDVGKALFVG